MILIIIILTSKGTLGFIGLLNLLVKNFITILGKDLSSLLIKGFVVLLGFIVLLEGFSK